jgi:hypothetical protein
MPTQVSKPIILKTFGGIIFVVKNDEIFNFFHKLSDRGHKSEFSTKYFRHSQLNFVFFFIENFAQSNETKLFAFWIYLRSFYSIYFVLVCFFKAELLFENIVQTMQL